MKKHFRLDIVSISPKGNYASVAKRHNLSADTLMVVQASKPGKVITEIIGMGLGTFFLGEKAVVAFGNGNAEYTNLETLKKKRFDNVRSVRAMPEKGSFIILDKQNKLSSYDQHANLRFSLSGVEGNSISGQDGYLFKVKKSNNSYEIVDVSSEEPLTIYSTDKLIRRIEMSFSKKWLSIIEELGKNEVDKKESLVLINNQTRDIHRPRIDGVRKDEFIGISEMAGGEGLLINLSRKIQKDKKIEIWYGNDGNLIDTELGFTPENRYLIFNPDLAQLKNVISERFDSFYPTGNKRYLLARKRGEGNNYTHGSMTLELYLWDVQTADFKFLDCVFPVKVYTPSKGNSLIYKNCDGKWFLVDVNSGRKKPFTKDFEQPVFSSTSDEIYLEGKDGFYTYQINKDQLKPHLELQGKEVSITKRKYLNMGSSDMSLYVFETESDKLLLKVTDTEAYTTSYQWLNKGKLENYIPITSDNIEELHSTVSGDSWYVRENYNRPMSVWFKSTNQLKPVEIITPNVLDSSACLLKQEILSYKNADGVPLNAILLYPENFDPLKKYPVIVRIYEVQNSKRNNYQTSSYDLPLEVDVRAMLKKGYFVYLPDMVFGKKGTGLSALDCINASLDVLKNKEFIDHSKLGLIGHSHGGYQTNFIATHSKRFAAYISGSGNADIIRSYHSYNYNFHSPFYYQFEIGQYRLEKSFVEDKALYFKNNPVHYVENVSAPILLWAGKKDKNIVWEQAMEFYIALRRNKKDVIGLFYPEQSHHLSSTSIENKDLYMKMIDWWDYFLKDRKDIPWIDRQMRSNK